MRCGEYAADADLRPVLLTSSRLSFGQAVTLAAGSGFAPGPHFPPPMTADAWSPGRSWQRRARPGRHCAGRRPGRYDRSGAARRGLTALPSTRFISIRMADDSAQRSSGGRTIPTRLGRQASLTPVRHPSCQATMTALRPSDSVSRATQGYWCTERSRERLGGLPTIFVVLLLSRRGLDAMPSAPVQRRLRQTDDGAPPEDIDAPQPAILAGPGSSDQSRRWLAAILSTPGVTTRPGRAGGGRESRVPRPAAPGRPRPSERSGSCRPDVALSRHDLTG